MFSHTPPFLKKVFLPVFFIYSTTIFSQTKVTVTDSNLHGWMKHAQHLGKIRFTIGPSKPPLQKGSLEFDAPVNGQGTQIRMRNNTYSGILLSSITELSYSTFVQKAGSKQDAPMLVLLVDLDGDGTPDGDGIDETHLSFTPRFQNPRDTTGFATRFGWYKPNKTDNKSIRWQYPVRQKVWQTWDAFHGGWLIWTIKGKKIDTLPTLYSLSEFIAQYPNARIVNDKQGGGVRLQAGGTPMANNFLGNADAFAIGINGKTTVYDFELSMDTVQNQTKIHPAKFANN